MFEFVEPLNAIEGTADTEFWLACQPGFDSARLNGAVGHKLPYRAVENRARHLQAKQQPEVARSGSSAPRCNRYAADQP